MFEVFLILRKDNNRWAFSGGKLDPYEDHFDAMKREFIEETLKEKNGKTIVKEVMKMFKKCFEIFKGYIDDSKNTDFAWMEGKGYACHDITGKLLKHVKWKFEKKEVIEVRWFTEEETKDLEFHASHKNILGKASKFLKKKFLSREMVKEENRKIKNNQKKSEMKKSEKKKSSSVGFSCFK